MCSQVLIGTVSKSVITPATRVTSDIESQGELVA